jgi:hypothetical protein
MPQIGLIWHAWGRYIGSAAGAAVRECPGDAGEHVEAERAPQLHGAGVGLGHGVELDGAAAVGTACSRTCSHSAGPVP